jgi:hypothetical protein
VRARRLEVATLPPSLERFLRASNGYTNEDAIFFECAFPPLLSCAGIAPLRDVQPDIFAVFADDPSVATVPRTAVALSTSVDTNLFYAVPAQRGGRTGKGARRAEKGAGGGDREWDFFRLQSGDGIITPLASMTELLQAYRDRMAAMVPLEPS